MNKKILIIEDIGQQRFIYDFNLKKVGFNTILAETGEKGLALALTDKPDLVLLDLMLPGIDGLGVCRQLKKEEKTQSIPVIIMTAKSQKKDIIDCMNAGADHFMVKPIQFNELFAKINELLLIKNDEDCELLKQCGFLIRYKGNTEEIKQIWMKNFCKNKLKSKDCERKKYKEKTGKTPPDHKTPIEEIEE